MIERDREPGEGPRLGKKRMCVFSYFCREKNQKTLYLAAREGLFCESEEAARCNITRTIRRFILVNQRGEGEEEEEAGGGGDSGPAGAAGVTALKTSSLARLCLNASQAP